MEKPEITRRSFVAGSAAVLSSTFLGFTGVSLAGCASSSPAEAAACKLSIADGSFAIEPSGLAKSFSGRMLSLVSDLATQSIKVVFADEEGLETAETLCDLGNDVTITGSIDLLTIDGTGEEGAFCLDAAGEVGTLSLGRVGQVAIAGSACNIIMLGGSDVEALEGSFIETVSMGSPNDDIIIDKGSSVGEVNALASHQVSGDAEAGSLTIIEDGLAFQQHAETLSSVSTLTVPDRKSMPAGSEGASGAQPEGQADANDGEDTKQASLLAGCAAESASPDGNASSAAKGSAVAGLFQPEEAYADELSDAAADSAEASWEAFLDEADDAEPVRIDDALIDEEAVAYPESTAVLGLQEVGIVEDLLLAALELIGTAVFDYGFDWGADKLFESLFGGDDTSVEILQKLDEIKEELDQIEKDVREILTLLQKQLYAQQIDNYLQMSVGIRPGIEFLDGMAQKLSAIEDKAEREKSQREFALNLLTNEKYKVDGRWVTEAAQRLGLELLQVYTSTNKNCLGAFDALLLYQFKWEHQGYEIQENFQQSVMANYITLLQYARLALMGGIETYAGDSSKTTEYNECLVWWENLFGQTDQFAADRSSEDDPNGTKEGNAGKVEQMAENQLLKKLDPSLRRYQVIGHEVVLEAQAVTVSSEWAAGMQQKQMFFNSKGQPCITKDQAVGIVGDYESPSVDSIFFNDAEGQFIKPEDFGDEFMYGPIFDEIYEEDILDGDGASSEDASGVNKKKKAKWEITRAPGFWPEAQKAGMQPDYYLGLCCCDINPDDGSMIPGTYAFWAQKAWTLFTAPDPRV